MGASSQGRHLRNSALVAAGPLGSSGACVALMRAAQVRPIARSFKGSSGDRSCWQRDAVRPAWWSVSCAAGTDANGVLREAGGGAGVGFVEVLWLSGAHSAFHAADGSRLDSILSHLYAPAMRHECWPHGSRVRGAQRSICSPGLAQPRRGVGHLGLWGVLPSRCRMPDAAPDLSIVLHTLMSAPLARR